MASKGHLASIGAGMYSDMSVAMPLTAPDYNTITTQAAWDALFTTEIQPNGVKASGTFVRIKNVREFPAMGTPPNVVNVPVFGQSTSQQIQGQADAPSMELTLNFVGTDWAKSASNLLGNAVSDGNQYGFRFAMLNSKPDGYASSAAGLGTTFNTYYYWAGKLAAMQVTPQLTDANQATLTITVQSEFYGAWTSA